MYSSDLYSGNLEKTQLYQKLSTVHSYKGTDKVAFNTVKMKFQQNKYSNILHE